MKYISFKFIDNEKIKEIYDNLIKINEINNEYLIRYNEIKIEGDNIITIMNEYKYNLDLLEDRNLIIEDGIEAVILKICNGIASLHNLGFINGNIKPSNILFNSFDELKISDFYYTTNLKINLNDNNIHYLSPEILSDNEISFESDIWSIGCIIYLLLYNIPPFFGNTLFDIQTQIMNYDCKYENKIGIYSLLPKILCKKIDRITLFELITELNGLNLNSFRKSLIVVDNLPVITFIKYEKDEFIFGVNEDIELECYHDGDNCKFSIDKKLPKGLVFDSFTGEIYGKCEIEFSEEYKIKCENKHSNVECNIKLILTNVIFIEENKKGGISIINKGKSIIKNKKEDGSCFINLKLSKGIHHIIFSIKKGNMNKEDKYSLYNGIRFGISSSKEEKFEKLSSLRIGLDLKKWKELTGKDEFDHNSGLLGGNGTKIENIYRSYWDNDEYEFIFNLINNTMKLKEKNNDIELWRNIKGEEFYILVNNYANNYQVNIKKYWQEK